MIDERELTVPFLPGMDEITVQRARVQLRGTTEQREAEGWSAVERSGGYLLALAAPARLRAVVIEPPVYDPPDPGAGGIHVVVRPATSAGTDWDVGPPMLASPPFDVGELYPKALDGLAVEEDAGSGHTVLRFPGTPGTAWLLQWAVGDDPTALTSLEVATDVRSVTVEPLAAGLTLSLGADDEHGADGVVVLWQFPGALAPELDVPPVEFTPIAANRLNSELAAGATSLSLPLRLEATTEGPVMFAEATLDATYRVHALASDAGPLQLRGGWATLTLDAPAALRPDDGTITLTARQLGRELNGRFPNPPANGGPGLTVSVDRWQATPITIEPPSSATTATSTIALASVTVDVAADAPAELVVEVREDVHGAPGTVLAVAVTQVKAGEDRWTEVLPRVEPVPPLRVGQRVWIALHTNQGSVRWYCDDDNAQPAADRTSVDRGATWAPVERGLAGAMTGRARLLHRIDDTRTSSPVIEMGAGAVVLPPLTLPDADDQQLDVALDAAFLDLLGRTTGTGKVPTTLSIISATALDVTVRAADLVYSPTARPTEG